MPDQTENNQITGTISSIIFRNPDNGYTVLKIRTGNKEEITAVGCMPGVSAGEKLEAQGRWTRHATYGDQFKVETLCVSLPDTKQAILKFLSSRSVKGIGERTARKLVDEFGEDTLRVIEQEPEKLTRVQGFTDKKAQAVHEAFASKAGMSLVVGFLGEHGLPVSLAVPLYQRYGPDAVDEIREDPYILTDEDFGMRFSDADRLAMDLGITGEDTRRLQAGILFELRYNLGNGHVFLPKEKLLTATQKLLNLNDYDLEPALNGLLDTGNVIQDRIAGLSACYLEDMYTAEVYVAFRLDEMCRTEFTPPDNLEQLIADIQKEQGIQYAPQQEQVIRLAAGRQVILLTGGPGTGKTTSLRGVLSLFEALGLETALAAPTGRAAKRLGQLCGAEASTIHRLLEIQFDSAQGQFVFSHNQNDPLACDAVIVDETSMVDLPLMYALLCALREDCRLVLVGDPDQLPSVGPGNLLSDLLHCGRIPSVQLTEVFRQAAKSAIIRCAHGINQGEPPSTENKFDDFFFLRRYESETTADTVVDLVARRLPENMGIPSDQIQVLSPTRKNTTGTANLNSMLQQALNPPADDKPERHFGDVIFRKGDRVMQIRNNYEVMWEDQNGRSGMGMYNGDIGQITDIDRSGTLTVDFDGKRVEYNTDMLTELELAYAITVHKSQGSEYRAVVLAVLDGAPVLLTRSVLYTAVTRAKEMFILVGDDHTVASMTANNRQAKRYSGLAIRLRNG